jgi:hypothetical protein
MHPVVLTEAIKLTPDSEATYGLAQMQLWAIIVSIVAANGDFQAIM